MILTIIVSFSIVNIARWFKIEINTFLFLLTNGGPETVPAAWESCALEGDIGFKDANALFPSWGSKGLEYASCQYQKDQPGFEFTTLLNADLLLHSRMCPPIPIRVPPVNMTNNIRGTKVAWNSILAGALVGPAEYSLGIGSDTETAVWNVLDNTQRNVFGGHEHHEYVFARCKVIYPGEEHSPPRYAMNAHTRIVPKIIADPEDVSKAHTHLFPSVVVLGGESQTRHGMRNWGRQASICLQERFAPTEQTMVSKGAYTYFDFSNYHPAGQYTVHSVPPLYSGRDYLSIPEHCETCLFELFKRNGYVTWGSDSMRFKPKTSINAQYAMGGKRPVSTADAAKKAKDSQATAAEEKTIAIDSDDFGKAHHWYQDLSQSKISMCNMLKHQDSTCSYCDSYVQKRHHCFGPKLIEEYHLSSLLQFLRAYGDTTGKSAYTMPKFAFHSNDANHWCNHRHGEGWKGNPRQAYNDGSYSFHRFMSTLLKDFDSNELPLIINVGDHGPAHYNIGDRRHDDVLMQVLVPNHILKQHPSMAASLMANQDKLLGPYDIYEVLHWIATGAGTSLHPLRTIPADEVWQTHFVDEEGKTKEQPLTFPLPPLNGTNIPHNFFKSNVSPSRSCKEAGLPKNIWRP